MEVVETKLPGVKLLRPRLHQDERGYFFESFRSEDYSRLLGVTLVQENESFSHQNVIRGLHFQTGDHAQGKLIRVISGKIFLVAIDLRTDSKTHGNSLCFELTDADKVMLWLPRGLANGYLVQSPTAIVSYKCDNLYSPQHEDGLRWDDPLLDLSWPIEGAAIVSAKDRSWPLRDQL